MTSSGKAIDIRRFDNTRITVVLLEILRYRFKKINNLRMINNVRYLSLCECIPYLFYSNYITEHEEVVLYNYMNTHRYRDDFTSGYWWNIDDLDVRINWLDVNILNLKIHKT